MIRYLYYDKAERCHSGIYRVSGKVMPGVVYHWTSIEAKRTRRNYRYGVLQTDTFNIIVKVLPRQKVYVKMLWSIFR